MYGALLLMASPLQASDTTWGVLIQRRVKAVYSTYIYLKLQVMIQMLNLCDWKGYHQTTGYTFDFGLTMDMSWLWAVDDTNVSRCAALLSSKCIACVRLGDERDFQDEPRSKWTRTMIRVGRIPCGLKSINVHLVMETQQLQLEAFASREVYGCRGYWVDWGWD